MNRDAVEPAAAGECAPVPPIHAAELTSATFSGAEHRDVSYAPHSHDGDQLFWFPDGGMDVLVDSRRWLVHADTVLWIPAGIVHSNRLLRAGATLSVYLSPSLRPPGDRWSLPRALALDPLLGALIRHLPGRRLSPVRREHCYRLLIDLLAEADDRETAVPTPRHPAARTVAEAVLADPADRTELADWAQRTGVSARTIARAFASETGLSFSAWRTKVRLLSALPLLIDGGAVHEAAAQSGYGSVGGFISAFAREFGATPAAYVRDRR
ncbi:AraC family transcriptional regulator [Brevibacterium celere]|uniref:helix-turn-helix transcriptional regulator n=1 Tax=Brevibacterium celere TaxID=225845 RepID=UPI0031E0CD2A